MVIAVGVGRGVDRAVGKVKARGLTPRAFVARACEERARRVEAWFRSSRASSRSVKERGCGERAIWSMCGLRGAACVLRFLRRGGSVLPRLRRGAPAGRQPAAQPGVAEDAQGSGVEPPSSGGLSRETASRNGRGVAGRKGHFDITIAVELRGGAGAREGECWKWNRTRRRRSAPERDRRRALRTLRAGAQRTRPAKRVESTTTSLAASAATASRSS